jgi:hypothetical protein
VVVAKPVQGDELEALRGAVIGEQPRRRHEVDLVRAGDEASDMMAPQPAHRADIQAGSGYGS